MKTEIIAKNYSRFFGEELNEADQVSKQGQDMSGGPIQQQDPAADPVGSFKPDEGPKDEQPPEEGGEGDDTKGKDTNELKDQIFDLLKEGETPESIIVKFFGKDDKGEDEIKKALEDLKSEGKIQDRKIWSVVASDEDEEKTGVGKGSTEDETDLEKDKEEEPEQPAPEMQQQPGAAPAAPLPGGPGAMPPNAMKSDEDTFASDDNGDDEDFKDDEFDGFDDDEEDEQPQVKKHPVPEMDDEEDDGEKEKVVDDIIDDVDDIKVLLKSIEPRLRKLREKSAAAKKVVG
jgi:hypothetical protein